MSAYRQDDPRFPYIHRIEWNGRVVHVLMTNERSVNWYGTNLIESNLEYLDLIKKGDVVIDCGANEGVLTVLAAIKAGPSGRVVAIEPAPHNMEPIFINARLNGVARQLSFIQAAVGEKDVAEIPFEGEAAVPQSESKVKQIALHHLHVPWVADVIKMDVEGYELKALRGATQYLRDFRPTIFLEPHLGRDTGGMDMRNYGDDPEQLFELMTDLGYRFYQDGKPMRGAIPNGAVVLRHEGRKTRRTLVYTVAMGEWYLKMARLWKASLLQTGYEGEIRIYSDIEGMDTVPVPTCAFADVPARHIFLRHIIGAMMAGNDYDAIMHMDADCIVLKPIRAMLLSAIYHSERWAFTEMDLNEGNEKYFLPPIINREHPDVWKRGIGGAVFAAKGTKFSGYCNAILKQCFELKAWEFHCQDQNVINGMVALKELPHKEWPKEWGHFTNIGSEPITAETVVVHFSGEPEKKYCYMKSFTELHNLCK